MPRALNDDVSIQYLVDGPSDAPTVVLLEGLGYGRWMWRWLTDALNEDFEVLRPDTRGTGQSDTPEGPYTIAEMAADVEAVLDHHGAETVALVGASMGGMIGMQYALEYDRAHALGLLCTSPGGDEAVSTPEDVLDHIFSTPEEYSRREALKYRMEPAVTDEFYAAEPDLVERIIDWRVAGDADDAGRDPADVDLVLYHGSEFKDHYVWSAAADIAERLGADNAFATESYTLCAGAPIAIRQAGAQLMLDHVDTALLVGASREEDLVDYGNPDSSFMFNFGSGASAAVLESAPGDAARAVVHESAAKTDGSFSRDVVMPAGGSRNPPSEETVAANEHTLDVPDPEGMKERLAPVSLPSFLEVADEALERSGFGRDAVDFVAITHMKRSFHERVLSELGCAPESDSVYLDTYGHVQSVDQLLALEEGLDRNRIESGDLLLFLAAGTGYTWAATVLRWQG